MEVTGPFTLALGVEALVTPPNGSIRFTKVVLANASPFACMVNSGGVQQWLQPWTADVFPADGGNPAYVTPQFTTASSSNNQITASWYLDIDPISGTYPVSLTAQAIAGTISLNQVTVIGGVGQILNVPANSSTPLQLSIPAGIQSIAIRWNQQAFFAGQSALNINNGASGLANPQPYWGLVQTNGSSGVAVLDVLGGQTNTINFVNTAQSGANALSLLLFIDGYPLPAAQVGPQLLTAGNVDGGSLGGVNPFGIQSVATIVAGQLLAADSISWQINPLTVANKTAFANPAGSGVVCVTDGALTIRNESGAVQVVNVSNSRAGAAPFTFDSPAGGLQAVPFDGIRIFPGSSLVFNNAAVNSGMALSGWYHQEPMV